MRSLSGANLFAIAMASRRCVCCKAHLYLQMRYVRQPRLLCRGATVYAASEAKPNIRRSRHDANLFAIVQDSWERVCRRHTYISKYHMRRQPPALCRGATVYAASEAKPNIRRSRHDANLFAIAMASCNCGCRKATVYLQIGCGQATETALPKRYSICGKRSEAEYTKKPRRCKLVCNCNGFLQLRVP